MDQPHDTVILFGARQAQRVAVLVEDGVRIRPAQCTIIDRECLSWVNFAIAPLVGFRSASAVPRSVEGEKVPRAALGNNDREESEGSATTVAAASRGNYLSLMAANSDFNVPG